MTVTEAFDIFKSELELPDRKQAQASKAQQEIRSRLAAHLDVPDSLLTGSYPRHTKIFPLDDIDILLIRNQGRVEVQTDGSGISPSKAIDQVAEAVGKAYPFTATVKKQARSVNTLIEGLDFGFDLIPAWLRHPDGYWIPDTDSNTWIPTDPEAHSRMMTEANARLQQRLKPVIKMAKHWNRNNFALLRSFHLELICKNIFETYELPNYPVGMASILLLLSVHLAKPMMDPIYNACRVDKPLSKEDQEKLANRITNDSQRAVEAVRLEQAGMHDAAIEKWKYIFFKGFPR